MRIIHGSDYYDSFMATDEDRETLFIRTKTEFFLKKKEVPDFPLSPAIYRYSWQNVSPIVVSQIMVGFCGKIYPCIKVEFNDKEKHCYNLNDLDIFIESNFKSKKFEAYKEKKWAPDKDWPGFVRQEKFKQFFDECFEKQESFKYLFEQHKSPIFVYICKYGQWELIINYPLKDVEFYHVFKNYEAYQELVMYFGRQAAPEKSIPEMSDELKAEQHGYDKFSFRKEKSK